MKRIVIFSMFLLGMLCGLTGCEDDIDGDWDVMKWSCQEMPMNKGQFAIPAAGQTLHIHCSNYNGVRFSDSKTFYYIDERNSAFTAGSNVSYQCVSNGWVKAVSDATKGDITVTIQPNTTGAERSDVLTVTAGDIFDTFHFTQAAK